MTPLENITVDNQQQLLGHLPDGAKLDYLEAIDSLTTKVAYTLNGVQTLVTLNKTDIKDLLGAETTLVKVRDLTTVNNVWEAFSDVTGLGLILNTDYDNDATTVDLNALNRSFQTLELKISDKSLLYYGSANVKTIASSLLDSSIGTKAIDSSLNNILGSMALRVTIITPSKLIFKNNMLTADFVNDIRLATKNTPHVNKVILDDLLGGIVVGYNYHEPYILSIYVKTPLNNLQTLRVSVVDKDDLPVLLTD